MNKENRFSDLGLPTAQDGLCRAGAGMGSRLESGREDGQVPAEPDRTDVVLPHGEANWEVQHKSALDWGSRLEGFEPPTVGLEIRGSYRKYPKNNDLQVLLGSKTRVAGG